MSNLEYDGVLKTPAWDNDFGKFVFPKAKRKKPSHPESDLQKACVRWFKLQYPTRIIFAIPNGGRRSKHEAAIMQGEGVMSGVADLFIPEPKQVSHGLWVEMKIGTGKLQDSQKSFLYEMVKRNYKTAVCYSLDEFMKVVNDYLK